MGRGRGRGAGRGRGTGGWGGARVGVGEGEGDQRSCCMRGRLAFGLRLLTLPFAASGARALPARAAAGAAAAAGAEAARMAAAAATSGIGGAASCAPAAMLKNCARRGGRTRVSRFDARDTRAREALEVRGKGWAAFELAARPV